MFSSSFKDVIAMALVEGCIFINSSLCGTKYFINGQPAHLCSNKLNPSYNGLPPNYQKIKVELKNNGVGEEDNNISVWCYDTSPNDKDFSLVGNTSTALARQNSDLARRVTRFDLWDFIDSAIVVVSHIDGNPSTIKIRAVKVKHRLPSGIFHDSEYDYDYRSSASSKYCVHHLDNFPSAANEKKRKDGCYLEVLQIQLWLRKMILRKRLIRLTKQLIPLYYQPEAKGGYFDRKNVREFFNTLV
jgi:hypothetical protein